MSQFHIFFELNIETLECHFNGLVLTVIVIGNQFFIIGFYMQNKLVMYSVLSFFFFFYG